MSAIKARANLYHAIRDYFSTEHVLAIETPLMMPHTVTDPHITSIATTSYHFLQSSPEYAIKRLIAAGIGDCYEITKAFRAGDSGAKHNPEFSLLEWYRLGIDHYALMDDVEKCLAHITPYTHCHRLSYQHCFQSLINIDPLQTNSAQCQAVATKHGLQLSAAATPTTLDDWLMLLMSHVIEPQLGLDAPIFIVDFPASQAALSQISPNDPRVAERFELYIDGHEIANGFHELTDAKEQLSRFEADQAYRQAHHLPPIDIDPSFIDALTAGLPRSSGVALGLDRLLMCLLKTNNIRDVIAFPCP